LTPPRKAHISFAAAQPKPPPSPVGANAPVSKAKNQAARSPPSSQARRSPKHNLNAVHTELSLLQLENTQLPEKSPVVGSVFDEYGEPAGPVFHDHYRAGQPKKLVDDCLKKERELRISPLQEEDDPFDKDHARDTREEEDDEEDDNEDDDRDPDDDSGSSDNDETPVHHFKIRTTLQINISTANSHLSSHAIYTPSRDVIDNFVPGTLDEDQLETLSSSRVPTSPHDIDPTYPSEDDDEESHSPASDPVLCSPVRFISRNKGNLPRLSMDTTFQIRSRGLSRTHSLPWQRKSYAMHLKQCVTKSKVQERPRCAAIAIANAIEHKKHHRRDKKEDVVDHREQKGLGVEAMAAMARQLTTKHTHGLLAMSV
jgi:hypothetical protein